MWTLFDPLVKPIPSETRHRRFMRNLATAAGRQAATTTERLWSLLEPTGPLSRKLTSRGRGDN